MSAPTYLLERGLSEATIKALGLRVEPLGALFKRYGLRDHPEAAEALALFIPYRRNGSAPFERVRLIDPADLLRFGGGKYRQPAGQSLALYDPFGALDVDVLDAVLAVEGEVNAISVHAAGVDWPVVGIPGQNALKEEMAAELARAGTVVLWLDAGDEFEQCRDAAVRHLRAAGAKDVRVCEPTEMDANEMLVTLGPAEARAIIEDRLIDAVTPEVQAEAAHAQAARRRAQLRLVDMSDAMRRAAQPLDYPCCPLAACGFLTVAAGRPGEAKTWLMLHVAHAVHSGAVDWIAGIDGLRCRRGKALYVDCENGAILMARRFEAMGIGPDGFHVADALGLRLPDDVDELEALIELTGADLVVLDSLRRLAPGVKENDSDEMAPLVAELARVARERDVAIVLIHHRSTKTGAATMRGSSSIEDQADLVFVLERVRGDRDRRRRKLHCTKNRIDPEPEPIWMRLTKTAGFVKLEGAEPFESDDGADVTEQERLVERIRALAAQVAADDGWSPSRLAEKVDTTSGSGTFKRAFDILVEAGEWEATGATSARRYRPLHLGQDFGPPIGGGPSGLSREEPLFDDGRPEEGS
jgi:hypothetical protein